MKLLFWLLDVSDELTENGREIHLWGLTDQSESVLIIEKNISPYFYILLEDKAEVKEVVRKVKESLQDSALVSEVVSKKFFGNPVRVIKVKYVKKSNLNSLKKISGIKSILEDDIRISSRYLIDNDVNPCGWHEIDVERIEDDYVYKVDKVYLAKSYPKAVERPDTPTLRVLSFSIVCHSKKGSPKPDKDPISIISVSTNRGEEKQFVAEDSDDRSVIENFINFVQSFNPDIIAGYGSNTFEWSYLLERAKKLGIKLKIDRIEGEPHTSVYGHFSITGRINIDFFEIVDEITEVKIKTLENVAEYFGVIKKNEIPPIEELEITSFGKAKRPILMKFSMAKSKNILKISQILLDFAIQLSFLVGLPLDHVLTAAVGFRTESYLVRQAHKISELIPRRHRRRYFPYRGAITLKPNPGLHEKIAVLDFKSMYPNIMIGNNISPDTYVKPKEEVPPDEVYVAPEVGHRFRKTPKGFYGKILSNLISERDSVKNKLENVSIKDPQYRILDARQYAIKTITNAVYGYAGWVGARWYIRPVAEATAAWGRYTIAAAIDRAKREGLDVIYGDTDSIFIKFDSEKIDKFTKAIEKKLNLEIKCDKIYDRILFTEAKKRYAGLLPDGRLDIVGLEVARGDWTEVAKKVQEGILECILKEKSTEKAITLVRQYVNDLKEKKIPYNDLIIWKTLTKDPSKYAVKAPHVEAAKRLLKKGWDLNINEKIGYVIVAGAEKLHERAIPYFLTSYNKLDFQYYEKQQIVPVALRILSIFDVSEEKLVKACLD